MNPGSPSPSGPRDLDVVRVLAPTDSRGLDEFLRATRQVAGMPFSPSRCAAVEGLSAAFLANPVLRRDPASVAAAYWIRRASVLRLKEAHERRCAADPGIVRVPVGRVFHVAPSNVDTLFMYSWALSFLSGNANLVRLSGERTPVVEAMLATICALAPAHPDLAHGDRFVTYEHDERITETLSAWCSHRVIWGGDETIAALRNVPLNPHASERLFGSKFSYAVIAADRYLAASSEECTQLAGAFFNDMFWFDQMACSSPQVVFWVGAVTEVESAVTAFADRLQAEAGRRAYVAEAPASVRRLAYAFRLAVDADVRVDLGHSAFVGVRANGIDWLDRQACGGGLIRHARIEQLSALADFAGEADQTVTHWGFAPEALLALAAMLGVRGVDRVVPVGEALAFSATWDGHDLLEDFVRKVTVRAR